MDFPILSMLYCSIVTCDDHATLKCFHDTRRTLCAAHEPVSLRCVTPLHAAQDLIVSRLERDVELLTNRGNVLSHTANGEDLCSLSLSLARSLFTKTK